MASMFNGPAMAGLSECEVTLGATLDVAAPPEPRWRPVIDRLAEVARGVYREVVYDDPRFVEYFRTATPEVELATVPIGSRPVRRTVEGGVDSLRAIPWVFAWTQTRLLLPSWLGTGEALTSALDAGLLGVLREMYEDWPFFRSTLDLIAMVLAESDARIAAEYDRRLVPPPLQDVGADLRRIMQLHCGVFRFPDLLVEGERSTCPTTTD